MVWVAVAELSVTVRVPVRFPGTCGLKYAETEQLAPAASVLPQALAPLKRENEVALEPPRANPRRW